MAYRKPTELNERELQVIRSVFTDRVFQNLIGGEEWSLSEAEEEELWNVIRIFEAWGTGHTS